jgi:hypothetical protein
MADTKWDLTFDDLYEMTRDLLGEGTADFWTNDDVQDAVHVGLMEVAKWLPDAAMYNMIDTAMLASADGVQETAFALPTDFWRVKEIHRHYVTGTSTLDYHRCRVVPYAALNALEQNAFRTPTPLAPLAALGNDAGTQKIYVLPIAPSAEDPSYAKVDYIKVPMVLADDTNADTPLLDIPYRHLAAYHAAGEMKIQEREFEQAQVFHRKFQVGIQQAWQRYGGSWPGAT